MSIGPDLWYMSAVQFPFALVAIVSYIYIYWTCLVALTECNTWCVVHWTDAHHCLTCGCILRMCTHTVLTLNLSLVICVSWPIRPIGPVTCVGYECNQRSHACILQVIRTVHHASNLMRSSAKPLQWIVNWNIQWHNLWSVCNWHGRA